MDKVKCPVCDGWGRRNAWRSTTSGGKPEIVDCTACKGTGVFSYELHFPVEEPADD